MRCGACTMTRYCGKECQKADWKKHKQVCLKRTSEPPARREEPVSFDSFYDPGSYYDMDGTECNDDLMEQIMGDQNKKIVPKSEDEAGFIYFMTSEGYSASLGKCVQCLVEWSSMPLRARFDKYVMPALENPHENMKSKSNFLKRRLKADAATLLAARLPQGLVSNFPSYFPISPFSGFFDRPDDDEISPHASSKPPHPSTYRFPIGAKVEARVGDGRDDWLVGKVVAHNYKEKGWPKGKVAPYQVEVSKGLLFVPTDSNMFVRPSDKYKKEKFEKWEKGRLVWK